MPFLSDLHRTVQTTLAGKRLGTPVFVRYQFDSAERPTAAPQRLAQLIAVVRDWMGQAIDRLYSVGSAKSGQIAMTVEFRGGATALVSWTTAPARGGVDLMLIGNHGVLYHDAGDGKLWDEKVLPLPEKPDQALVALVEEALRSGQPEAAGKGGAP